MTRSLRDLLSDPTSRVDLGSPASDAELAAAAEAVGRPLPDELELFYRLGGFGAHTGHVDVFSRHDFFDVQKNWVPDIGKGIPSAVYFASDGSDGFFFVDADGSLGRGAGAVLWTDRAECLARDAVPSAGTLSEFLERAAAGDDPWLGKSLRRLDIDAMQAALASAGIARPAAASTSTLLAATQRVGVRLAAELEGLLGVADGGELPSGISLDSSQTIAPVAGAVDPYDRPGAVWFASGSDGKRYAVTTGGWRESEGGRVIAVAPGQSAVDAPILDSLPGMVRRWLASDTNVG